jgi:hypothetical protein
MPSKQAGEHAPPSIAQNLRGAHFPASKEDLVELARANGAKGDVLHTLENLPGSQYRSVDDVMKAAVRH